MDKEKNILESLKGRNPFRVPDGYFEGFTDLMMSRLPDKPAIEQGKKISLFGNMRPLLYLAAAFVGVIILFNVFNVFYKIAPVPDNQENMALASVPADEVDEDADFLEYIEDLYADKYALSYIEDYYYDYE